MLRLLALLLPLLPPSPVSAPEPSAQDVSLGVVSAGVFALLGSAGWGWGPDEAGG